MAVQMELHKIIINELAEQQIIVLREGPFSGLFRSSSRSQGRLSERA